MRSLILAATALALAGCSFNSQPSTTAAQETTDKLRYVKDARTDECFAMVKSSSFAGPGTVEVSMITWVPCNPKVLEQISGK